MANSPELLIKDWLRNDRPLLIIDETRRYADELGELVLFAAIQTSTKRACSFCGSTIDVREKLPKQMQDKCYKGKDFFGNHERKSLGEFKQLVINGLVAADNIIYLLTHSKAIKEKARILSGGLNAVPGPRETRPGGKVFGPELIPVLNFVKKISIDQHFGDSQVNILIDRSAQLGLDPAQRSLPQGQFETFGPSTLNGMADGSISNQLCPSPFYIISAPETGMFMDLLLLPDAAAYLSLQKADLDKAKALIPADQQFYTWYVSKNQPPWNRPAQ